MGSLPPECHSFDTHASFHSHETVAGAARARTIGCKTCAVCLQRARAFEDSLSRRERAPDDFLDGPFKQPLEFWFGTSLAAGGFGFDGTTQLPSPSELNDQRHNGVVEAEISRFEIRASGVVYSVFRDERAQPVAQLALARFARESELLELDSGLLMATDESGGAQLDVVGGAGRGELQVD